MDESKQHFSTDKSQNADRAAGFARISAQLSKYKKRYLFLAKVTLTLHIGTSN